MAIQADQILDVKGQSCPMPVVKTKKAMDQLEAGQILEVQATDKGAKSDLSAWTKSSGHELVEENETDDLLTFWIKKG